jgi:23S rRNA (pseudouridine1915-N3)-methyltransferase
LKIKFIQINKTDQKWVQEGIEIYEKRIVKYIAYEKVIIEINTSKGKTPEQTLLIECDKVFGLIKSNEILILLDEIGQEFNSLEFAQFLNKRFTSTSSDIVFLIGGAYGFHEKLKQRANFTIALSKLTFTHQMVRVIFLEQLYRAMTILKNEPYHHL